MLEWEFHVVLDPTYEVPAAYARACRVDGSALSVEDVLLELPPTSTGVSLEDHPVLNEPFLFFHACSTHELLDALDHDQLPLLTWFLVAGPNMGLRIDPRQWPTFLKYLDDQRNASENLASLANKARLWI
mmetsp:Transcript_32696/g.104236  ORF Transcript_32696/g.104236 Transcript_32696/m.104236 type:complete len:130 (+) Transcript_32696:287-676(+)